METVNFLNIEHIFLAVYEFFKNFNIISIINWILWFIDLLKPVALILTLVLITVIVYSKMRLRQLKKEEDAIDLKREVGEVAPEEPELNKKWIQVQEHINSTNPNDWRMAIIEADIMLGEILTKAGYYGDTIGEQLKSIEDSDMLTLQSAWEAHKARNLIAHEGGNFELNDREAKRIIGLFEQVFKEFYYI
jgi:hypothetical protein